MLPASWPESNGKDKGPEDVDATVSNITSGPTEKLSKERGMYLCTLYLKIPNTVIASPRVIHAM